MDISQFLFANANVTPDPKWFVILVAAWSLGLLFLPWIGKKVLHKEQQKAAYKTLKKSSTWLKTFGIISAVLLWFRLETIRFLSMKFWFVVYLITFIWFVVSKWRYYLKLRKRIARNK